MDALQETIPQLSNVLRRSAYTNSLDFRSESKLFECRAVKCRGYKHVLYIRLATLHTAQRLSILLSLSSSLHSSLNQLLKFFAIIRSYKNYATEHRQICNKSTNIYTPETACRVHDFDLMIRPFSQTFCPFDRVGNLR